VGNGILSIEECLSFMHCSAVLFPVIALGISTLFEGYQWSVEAVFGFVWELCGFE
jgi:hypothetical protein